jgi:Na+-transporting methylmalonyl-CoA/oxaloacetate decarboxylase gamma subunit
MTNPTISDTLLISLIGFVTVFAVLVVLMFIIQAISKVVAEKKTAPVAAPAPAAAPTQETVDSYTGVKLIGVSDKDAALIMAIVANDLDISLDNLRFISIKEVK